MAVKDNTDTFIFYPTFLTSIEAIKSEAVQLAMFKAVINYGLYGTMPDFSEIDPIGTLDAAFVPIRYAIDEAKAKRSMYSEFGRKGGAPKGNKNAAKQHKTSLNNPKQGKQSYVYVNGNVNDNISSNEDNTKSTKRFSKPTLEEIQKYCREKGFNVDAADIYDYYESKGWLVGKAPMKDWRAAVRGWVRREKEFAKPQLKSNDARRGIADVSHNSGDDYEGEF